MLDIIDLSVSFTGSHAADAVRDISLHMDAGERLGLVGESGSGKTCLALTIAGLIERRNTEISGRVLLEGRDLLQCSRGELRRVQGRDIGFVFQEPMTSLNPLMKIGRQVEEALRIHTGLNAARRRELVLRALEDVGLPEPEITIDKYPSQLSGGQRQRAMIAAAYIGSPKLLICDEPTTALDVTVQAQILQLLRRINEERGIAILFISHDLHVVRRLCSRVAVMKDGQIVESGPADEVFLSPRHEYTKKLIAAIPTRDKRHG